MSGTLSFKVYMRTEENESKLEVRRFGIEVDAVTSFLYLREKIQTIFPALRGKHFTISWKDSDGDDVCISSNEELEIALNEMSDEIRKLHVLLHSEYETRGRNTTASNSEGAIHLGTTCDGCEGVVRGFRYKCVQCPDYDLCADCEASGMHPEHCMIRISMPLQWKPHMGKRLACQVNKFVRRAQPQNRNAEDEPKQQHQQCPYRSGRHSGRNRRGAEDPSWLETFASYLDEWANLPGECPAKEAAKEATKEAAKEATKEATKETPNKPEKKSSPEPATSSETRFVLPNCRADSSEQIEELLKNVGLVVGEKFMSHFMDPLLNMHTAAAEKPEEQRAEATSSTPATNIGEEIAASGAKETTGTPKFPGEGKTLRDNVAAAANFSANEAAAAPAGKDEATPPAKERRQSDDKISVDSEQGWTLLNSNESPPANPGAASSTGAVPKVTPSAPAEKPTKLIYPELPTQQAPEQKPVYHSNPTIQKSVESMIAMGFSNNGGWLTNLLVSKGGDIAAALDALSPAQR